MPVPSYLIDDQTAIKVADGTIEVVSEGNWKLFTPGPEASYSVRHARSAAPVFRNVT